MKFVEETFTPSEAEAITGVSTTTQRDWRRNGYLPDGDGSWTRYSIEQIAFLFITGMLAKFGVKPSVSTTIAAAQSSRKKSAVALVTIFAKNNPKALSNRISAGGELPIKPPPAWTPPRFLIAAGADAGDLCLADDTSKSFDGSVPGAITIDLRSIADLIVKRAGKPLVRVAEDD